eukprot:s84_g22.t1
MESVTPQPPFDVNALVHAWFASSWAEMPPADGSDDQGTSSSSDSAQLPSTQSGGAGSSSMPLPEIPQFARDVYALHSAQLRHVQLRGPPQTWSDQVLQLWQDVMIPQVAHSIDIVTPSPPRSLVDLGILCDLILAQGIEGTLVAGLVTVRPLEHTAGPRQFSGAVAFGAAVDRYMIIAGLDLVQTCNRRHCQVRHGRTVFSQTALHQMYPGHGFLIDVGHLRSTAAPCLVASELYPLSNVPSDSNSIRPVPEVELLHRSVPTSTSATVANIADPECLLSCPSQQSDPLSRVAVSISADWCVLSQSIIAKHLSHASTQTCQTLTVPSKSCWPWLCPVQVGDPLSLTAVSISPGQCLNSILPPVKCDWSHINDSSAELALDAAQPLYIDHFLLTDESQTDHTMPVQSKLTDPAEQDGRNPDRTPEALRPVPPPNRPVQPVVLPAFVHDMFLDLPEEFLAADIFQRGFVVRTWYIHHQTIRRSRVSRCIHLRGPPMAWQALILTTWFDVLVPLEAVEIDLVKPRPPRTMHEGRLAFDIILSQGLEVDRFAGLITVSPSVHTPLVPRYHMAVSFPPEVHGQLIIDIIAFHRVCQTYQCFVAHRWTQLPISPLPVHVMQPGDSFVVGVFTRIPESDVDRDSVEVTDNQFPAIAQGPQPMDCDSSAPSEVPDRLAPSPAPNTAPGSSSAATNVFCRKVHLHRLGHLVVTVQVQWPLSTEMVSLIAPMIGVGPWEIYALHPLQAAPAGDHEDDYAFIVQTLTDVDFGLPDQLWLLDVFVHQHGPQSLESSGAFHDRRVVKSVPLLTRNAVLQLAHLADYCEFVRNRCLVKINGILWPFQDTTASRITHGHYIQVIVPPPKSHDVPVLRAIELVEDFGCVFSGDSFGDHYPEWRTLGTEHNSSVDAGVDAPVEQTPALRPLPKLVGSSDSQDQFVIPQVAHANDDQVQDPPNYAHGVGWMQFVLAPAQHPLPTLHDFQEFLVAFRVTFERLAEEEFDGQGPVVQVITWYIHHGQVTECQRHHTVELDADPATWPASLCAPWTDLIQINEPLAFREVLPNPPRHHNQRHVAHVILEQGIQHERYASLFSILVQGTHHDGMFQKAYSTPQSVAAEDLLTLAGLQDRCQLYRCTAWSGVMMFHPAEREPIFSGISIKLHVHRPQCRHHLLDFGDQPFWHPPPVAAASSSVDVPARVSGNNVPFPKDLLAEPEVHPHFDGLFRPDLLTAWHVFLAQATAPPFLFRVQTWFCDHIRYPRSNEGRVVQLPIEADSWKQTLNAAWSDWLLPGIGVQYYVVSPDPPSAAVDVVAHVIIAQNQLPDFISVLISTLAPDDDPYFPSHRVVKLPRIVDHWMLVHECGLMLYCPPFVTHMQCRSWIGPSQILPQILRPSMSGDGFLVTAEAPPPEDAVIFHSTLHRIDRLFSRLADHFSSLVSAVCTAASISFHTDQMNDAHGVPNGLVPLPTVSSNATPGVDMDFSCLTRPPGDAPPSVPQTKHEAPTLPPKHDQAVHPVEAGSWLSRERLTADVVAHAQRPRVHTRTPLTFESEINMIGSSFSPAAPPCQAKHLILADHVPEPVWTTIDCHKIDFQRRQLLTLVPSAPSFSCDWSKCTASTISALECTPPWDGTPPQAVHFYTDGSFRPTSVQASAGVVLVLETADGMRFGGFHTAWCWQTPSAPRAETSAVIVALMWALQLAVTLDCRGIEFVFHFESVYAGRVAQGICMSELNQDLTVIARSLALWLEQFLWSSPQWLHVKGHSDDPWNDLADVVAGQAIDMNFVTFDIATLASCCTFDGADLITQQWIWLFERSLQGRSDAPVLHQLQWKLNAAAPLQSNPDSAIHPFMRIHVPAVRSPIDRNYMRLRFATANVLTLYPGQNQASGFLGARAEDLASQFHQAGIHCIGIQETRFRGDGHRFFEGFHVLSASASNKGHGGVQFWCAQTWKFPSGALHIDHSHLRILHGDNRRLIVQFSHPRLRLIFVILHAPCDDDEKLIHHWWAQTSALIPSRFASWTWIVLCDSNSRLGSVTSSMVGDFGAETESMRGSVFHEWLVHHSIRLPQTFEVAHSGEHCTWSHASQGHGRIDFIGVSDDIPVDWISTWIATDVDLSTVRQDHACVCGDVWFAPKDSNSRPQEQLPVGPPVLPTWYHDVHTHAALLQETFRSQVTCSPRDHMRKKHLSDGTLSLIHHKKVCRQAAMDIRAKWRHFLMAHVFQAWRDPATQIIRDDRFITNTFITIAQHEEAYRIAALKVCHAVREDDSRFYEQLAEETGFIADHGYHRTWNAIKPVLPKWRHRRKNNMRCCGPPIDDQVRHYCALEGGVDYPYPTLLRDCHDVQKSQIDDMPLSVNVSQLPSRIDVENRFQNLTVNRAPGIDGLSPTFLRANGPELAESVFQLALKMWITGHEPLQFKGGLLHSITKKVLSRDVANMRGIMLLDVLGKIMHSLMRQRFLPSLLQWRHPLQLGGFPRCSTLFATHYLRAVHDRAQDLNLSSAVLFIDVKSAFHSLIRQVLLGGDRALPDHLQAILETSGCDLAALLGEIDHASRLFTTDVPLCEQRLLQDAHDFTWFGLTGSSSSFCTSRGSRPGSPLADVAFNALMVHVLSAFQQALNDVPSLQSGLQAMQMPAPPVTWVDDVAVPVLTLNADELEPTVAAVADAAIGVFQRFGLIINLKPRKTEVVMTFRGSGAPKMRHDLLIDRLGRIPLPHHGLTLQCVAQYEHLGTIFSAAADMQCEVTHRRHKAMQAHRQVAKPVFRNRHVAVTVRLKLFESLIIPVLLHGAGNWKLLSARQYQSLHAVIIGWQRSILQNGFWTPDQLTDFEVQCRWQLPPLSLRLAKARLLYAFHCVQDGPSLLLDYITAVSSMHGSWFCALRQGLRWLASMDSEFCAPSLANDSIEQVVEWLNLHATDGPRRVRRLFRRCLLQYHVLGDAFALHKQLRDTLRDGGIHFDEVPVSSSARDSHLFACDWCPHSFDTFQKLQVHHWVAHQLVSDERRFVFSATCLACNRCFWSAARLQQHLRLSRRSRTGCYAQLTWRYAPLTVAHTVEMPEDLRGFRRMPAVSVSGPALAPVEIEIPSQDAALRLLTRQWHREGLPDYLDEDTISLVFHFADEQIHHWNPQGHVDPDEVIFTLSSFVDEDDSKLWALCTWQYTQLLCRRFPHLDVSYFQRLKTALQDLLLRTPLGRLLAWKRRIDEAFQPLVVDDAAAARVHLDLETFVNPFAFQGFGFDVFRVSFLGLPDCSRVPVTIENGQPTIWILHLFSGRQRRGDCHYWVQCCQHILHGFVVRILSVDTAIHPELGNLDRGPYFAMMLKIIRKGFFAAGLTGPPCETFSAARHVQLPGPKQPRPLRSSEWPWLIPYRTGRELYQTMIGTRLLFHSLISEAALVLSGAGSVMEHPTENPDDTKASVWRTDVHHQWIMQLPGAFEHHIQQWRYGAKGIKPTTLRALNLGDPSIMDKVLSNEADPLLVKPTVLLAGRADCEDSVRQLVLPGIYIELARSFWQLASSTRSTAFLLRTTHAIPYSWPLSRWRQRVGLGIVFAAGFVAKDTIIVPTANPIGQWDSPTQMHRNPLAPTRVNPHRKRGLPGNGMQIKEDEDIRMRAAKGHEKGKSHGDAHGEAPPWPTPETSTFPSPFAQQTPSSVQPQQDDDLVGAVKDLYPDLTKAPARIQAAVAKAEKTTAKQLSTGLSKSSKTVGNDAKELQQLRDARAKHRERWLKHLKDSVDSWELQLKQYKEQQANYNGLIRKAQTELSTARQTLAELNQKAADAAGAEEKDKIEADLEAQMNADTEAQLLVNQVQAALQTCVKPAIKEETMEISDGDEEAQAAPAKRPRSMEPFPRGGAGAGNSGPSPTIS